MLALSLLVCCAAGTLAQKASRRQSRLLFWLDLGLFYVIFLLPLAAFGWSFLTSWSTLLFVVVALDVSTVRERHVVEYGEAPELKAPTEHAWTPVPYLILGAGLLAACFAGVALSALLGVLGFNLLFVAAWHIECWWLERRFPQCRLHSRPKIVFRKNQVESVVFWQAVHRLPVPAVLFFGYVAACKLLR